MLHAEHFRQLEGAANTVVFLGLEDKKTAKNPA